MVSFITRFFPFFKGSRIYLSEYFIFQSSEANSTFRSSKNEIFRTLKARKTALNCTIRLLTMHLGFYLRTLSQHMMILNWHDRRQCVWRSLFNYSRRRKIHRARIRLFIGFVQPANEVMRIIDKMLWTKMSRIFLPFSFL